MGRFKPRDRTQTRRASTDPVRVETGTFSLFVTVAGGENDTVNLTLAHPYPDYQPTTGQVVTGRGLDVVVESVAGPAESRVITCKPRGGEGDQAGGGGKETGE